MVRNETKNVVAVVAFLIGAFKSKWIKFYGDECMGLLTELENNQDAVAIRYLCKMRTALMLHYSGTDRAIMNELKNINSLDKWYDTENIKQLEKWGYQVVLQISVPLTTLYISMTLFKRILINVNLYFLIGLSGAIYEICS